MKKIMLIDEVKVVNYAGGIERVMCNFANAFVKRGYKVSFVCLDTEKGTPFYFLENNVKFINLAFAGEKYANFEYYFKKIGKEILRIFCDNNMMFWGKKFIDPKKEYFKKEFIRRLKIQIEIIKPDVIICVSADSTYFAWKASNKKIPIITMCHIDAKRMIDNMEWFQREALSQSKYIQVLMPSYMPVIKKAGFNDVVCIPNVVEQIDKSEKINLYKEKEHYNIITVGRVERDQKRTHLLVEAFVKIADKFPNWNVEIYGDLKQGSYIKMIKKIITDKQLENRVFLKGVTKHIKNRLKEADIFAFPSAYEGFSLALTEAMSIGLPIVGYKNCNAVSELIIDGENGFLCEDGVDDFSDKLAKLMEDKELRRNMGDAAYTSMKKFAPEEIWDKWENIIKKVIVGKRCE